MGEYICYFDSSYKCNEEIQPVSIERCKVCVMFKILKVLEQMNKNLSNLSDIIEDLNGSPFIPEGEQ